MMSGRNVSAGYMPAEEELNGVDIYALEEGEIETQNRLQNLMWTVSGDYSQNTQLDYAVFRECRYAAMYDAVKQGGFARYFNMNDVALYLLKKVHLGAEREPLTNLTQLCVDAAVYPRLVRERPGIKDIRREAFSYLLDRRFKTLSATLIGRVKLAFMRGCLTESWIYEQRILIPLNKVRLLEEGADTERLIRTIDELYNTLVDPHFEKMHGDLESVMRISLDELKRDDWKEFLEEEAREQRMEQLAEKLSHDLSSMDRGEGEDEEREGSRADKIRVINVDQEAVLKMYSYIEKNFGKSYLTEQQQKVLNYRLCKGVHGDCSLYYTDGIIDSHVVVNAQYVNARKKAQDNVRELKNHAKIVRQNVDSMTDFLKRSLVLRSQKDWFYSDHGSIIPRLAWKIGRIPDPGKLFSRENRRNTSGFVVEVLIDASGSQQARQAKVAMQAYIISAAMSGAHIPHRMMSFCSFWDYTVMQRFRDFDDPPEKDRKVLEYTTSSNNRDGLAILAAGDDLLARAEENKILIILSDGRPNDIIVGRPGSHNPKPYTGEAAIADTARAVRHLRAEGIYVLGVFTGKDKDLQAEKRIFGKDFAYIRDIRHFSRIVTGYLQRLLEMDQD